MKKSLAVILLFCLCSCIVTGCDRDKSKDDQEGKKQSEKKPRTDADQETEDPASKLLNLAMDALEKKNEPQAKVYFEELFEKFPDTAEGKKGALELGRLLSRKRGKEVEALKYLKIGLPMTVTPEELRQVRDKIAELEKKLRTEPPKEYPIQYKVKGGDTLEKIAKQYKIPTECMFLANRHKSRLMKDPTKLQINETLLVDDALPKIKVIKSKFELQVWYKDKLIKSYPIGTGKTEKETPLGTYEIVSKVKFPTFKGFPYGHPENRIGDMWLRFRTTARNSGLGLHGTTQPETIGKKISNGCIRLKNSDILKMEKFIPRGTFVEIVE